MLAKVLIADDHDIVRQKIRSLLNESRPEWQICAEASNGRQAVEAAKQLKPDIVILDITMPDMNGLEAAARISKLCPESRILIFTMHDSDRLGAAVREVGGHGYIQKSRGAGDLVAAMERLMEGGTFFENRGSE